MTKYFHEINSNVTLERYVPEGKLPLGSIAGSFPPHAPGPLIKGWRVYLAAWLKSGYSLESR
jgi:hypothetical protein